MTALPSGAVDLLDAALGYAARGWKVFPVWPPSGRGRCACPRGADCGRDAGKHPVVAVCAEGHVVTRECETGGHTVTRFAARGHLGASSDARVVRGWWTHPLMPAGGWNIGLALASSGLVAVDLDSADAVEFWSMWEHAVPTWCQDTGRGEHHVYQAPAGVRFAGGLSADADIKHNGYIVAAPSVHAAGRQYTVMDDRAPVELTDGLLAALTRRAGSLGEGAALADQALDNEVVSRALAVSSGDRSADTFRVIAACVASGYGVDTARAVVRSRADLAGRLDERLRRSADDDDVQRCWQRAAEEALADRSAYAGLVGAAAEAARAPLPGTPLADAADGTGVPSWAPVDPASAGPEGRKPLWFPLPGESGLGVFYPGAVNWVIAEPESGKSWLLVLAAQDALTRGQRVLYLDFDSDWSDVGVRFRAVGVDPVAARSALAYVRPDADPRKSPEETVAFAALVGQGWDLVVVDGANDALGTFGLKSSDGSDVTTFRHIFLQQWVARGAGVIVADHVTKDKESRGRWAVGAQEKMAMVTGSAVLLGVEKPVGRGLSGELSLSLGKDKRGWLRAIGNTEWHRGSRIQELCRLSLTSNSSGSEMDWAVVAGVDRTAREDAEVSARELERAAAVRAFVSSAAPAGSGGVTRNAVAAAVAGRRGLVMDIIADLVSCGDVEEIATGGIRISQEGHSGQTSSVVPGGTASTGTTRQTGVNTDEVGQE